MSPATVRMPKITSAMLMSLSLFQRTTERTTQLTTNATTAQATLPERGPTPSSNWSFPLIVVLASAQVVIRPRTKLPTPAAIRVADGKPSRFRAGMSPSAADSFCVIVATCHVLLEYWRRFRDEGAHEAGNRRRAKGEDEETEYDRAYPRLIGQPWAVVDDNRCNCGGDDWSDPCDVLFPLHAEVMPFLQVRVGE